MSFIKAGVCIDSIEGKRNSFSAIEETMRGYEGYLGGGDVLENGRKPLHQSVAQANWSLRYHK
jgi:hypothetical protein